MTSNHVPAKAGKQAVGQMKVTPERIAEILTEARRLRGDDSYRWNWSRLARRFHVRTHWLRCKLDDDYAYRTGTAKGVIMRAGGPEPMTKKQLAARLSARPEDTRTFTEKFFGDPLPGRSALDARRRETEVAA